MSEQDYIDEALAAVFGRLSIEMRSSVSGVAKTQWQRERIDTANVVVSALFQLSDELKRRWNKPGESESEPPDSDAMKEQQ